MTTTGPAELVDVAVEVNGELVRRAVHPRVSAADFLRNELGLTGTHVGCEHGVCGACTVLLDGTSVRSCLLFAVQLRGHEVLTVEGLAGVDGELHPIPGLPPRLDRLPVGCPFAPRCPMAVERCRVEPPSLDAAREGHEVACHRWDE